ncbi:MAG: Coenzyme F420 hydrogenase/dehydrogenase, beta subunit C-terminal domain [Methanocorpusculum sp.]|nr:Coenzyme F420 hydrogenase/dehydrogenase, beta subunit C-terminal domain [Methanocorpusculum sp.]
MSTVLETTVASGFCCGCGVCAGMCPEQNLVMELNRYGEYNPGKHRECTAHCGLCEKVCPFLTGNPDENELGKILFSKISGIYYRPETGYYLSCGVGAVTDTEHRMASASGGLATWFLEELLHKQIVDAVICVEHADDGRLFRFCSAATPEEVRKGTGSVYYPVEISGMLRKIMTEDKRYAVIALPCVLKGLRLAQQRIPKLRERIVVMAGLTCNHLPSANFTGYAAYCSGLQEKVARVSYRCKSNTVPRVLFTFQFVGVSGTKTAQKWDGSQQMWNMFGSRFCSLHSCDCCDDIWAECADVVFMDAWLPEYSQELRGTSLWISRSPLVDQIFIDGITSNSLEGNICGVDLILRSANQLCWKREMLSYRLHLMQENGEHPPAKRVEPGSGKNLSFLERDECRKCLEIQQKSRMKTADGYAGVSEWFDAAYADRPLLIRICKTILHLLWMGKHAPGYLLRHLRKWCRQS